MLTITTTISKTTSLMIAIKFSITISMMYSRESPSNFTFNYLFNDI